MRKTILLLLSLGCFLLCSKCIWCDIRGICLCYFI